MRQLFRGHRLCTYYMDTALEYDLRAIRFQYTAILYNIIGFTTVTQTTFRGLEFSFIYSSCGWYSLVVRWSVNIACSTLPFLRTRRAGYRARNPNRRSRIRSMLSDDKKKRRERKNALIFKRLRYNNIIPAPIWEVPV